jgi:leucyl/phenylalanyl-tRNA--protein transferase
MLFRLDHDPTRFPNPELAEPDGLLAVGGDLSPERLLTAYSLGIFPWFNEKPYLWWSPDPRCIILPDDLHLPSRLARILRGERFELRMNTAFAEVCRACAESPRPGQTGTWITDDMFEAYLRLHELGFAHSVEAWRDGSLAGGFYGIWLGQGFFGESMFYRQPDASKAAFAGFAGHFFAQGGHFIDCQQETDHMLRFGARLIPRIEFLERLELALKTHPDT